MLRLDGHEAAPGEIVRGCVEGGAEAVRLLRVETSPPGPVMTLIDRAAPDAAGAFELTVPEVTAPTFHTRSCAISYVVRAGGDRRRATDPVADVVVRGRLDHVSLGESVPTHDRMIARFDARHFHLELVEADMQGGGRISGRVHLDRGDPPPMVTASVRCDEVWRVDRVVRNLRRPLLWQSEELWRDGRELEWPDDQRWLAFAIDLPKHLPPATEGRSMAWRYEVEVSRPTRLAMHERAVITPIGYELHGA